MKNQIIGSRTKKLDYLSLGAVPCVVSILSIVVASMHSGGGGDELLELIAIQAAAIIGSFACRLESGVEAVLEAGACAFLMILITHQNEKVNFFFFFFLPVCFWKKLVILVVFSA